MFNLCIWSVHNELPNLTLPQNRNGCAGVLWTVPYTFWLCGSKVITVANDRCAHSIPRLSPILCVLYSAWKRRISLWKVNRKSFENPLEHLQLTKLERNDIRLIRKIPAIEWVHSENVLIRTNAPRSVFLKRARNKCWYSISRWRPTTLRSARQVSWWKREPYNFTNWEYDPRFTER